MDAAALINILNNCYLCLSRAAYHKDLVSNGLGRSFEDQASGLLRALQAIADLTKPSVRASVRRALDEIYHREKLPTGKTLGLPGIVDRARHTTVFIRTEKAYLNEAMPMLSVY